MSGQTVNGVQFAVDGEWPDRLRRGVHSALQACLLPSEEWSVRDLDVHHIVAAGLDGAMVARRLLSRWSISVHSVVNAAIVPRRFHQRQGLHRQEFLHAINLRVASAELFAEAVLPHGGFAAGRLILMQTIQKIGIELVARSEDAVAIRLQGALQTLVAQSMGGSAGVVRSDVGRRSTVRSGRERFLAASGEGRLDSAAVNRSRRSCLQHASACP